jgi:histidyl-tRNA synthetase
LYCAAGILSALSCRCLDQLGELLGASGADALAELRQLWALAEGYGFKDWLVFDASVVRGLAYYTGGFCTNCGFGDDGLVMAETAGKCAQS